jgi:hypothetical protein
MMDDRKAKDHIYTRQCPNGFRGQVSFHDRESLRLIVQPGHFPDGQPLLVTLDAYGKDPEIFGRSAKEPAARFTPSRSSTANSTPPERS